MICKSIIFPLLTLNVVIFGQESAFTVDINSGEMNCFFEVFNNSIGKSTEIHYQIIDGGDLDIDFIITDENANTIIAETRQTNRFHSIPIQKDNQQIRFCFDNTFSYANKRIFFQIYVVDASGNVVEQPRFIDSSSSISPDMAELGVTANRFAEITAKIKNNLNRIEQVQLMMKAYENRDRSIMDANFDRVSFWSFTNLSVMMFVAAFQVYMIRSLFKDQSSRRMQVRT